jgi:hypothetical protein
MSVDHRRAHVLVGQNHIKNLFQTFQSFQPCLKQNQDGSVKAKFAWKFWNLSWQLVPCPAVQLSASDFLSRSTPLFKEKRNSLRNAPISNLSHPSRIDVA